jgi:hypothetical protein
VNKKENKIELGVIIYKKIIACIAALFFSCLFVNAQQNKTDTVTDKDYYDFFNSTENPFPVTRMSTACNPDTFKICNLNDIPEYNTLIDDTTEILKDSTMFTKADRAFIRRQMIHNRAYRWKDGEMKMMKVINGSKVKRLLDSLGPDDGWKAYYSIYKLGYNRFSVPLFSCDKLRCIVYRGYDCGSVYGLGNTNAFENRAGKWIIIKSCSPWVH